MKRKEAAYLLFSLLLIAMGCKKKETANTNPASHMVLGLLLTSPNGDSIRTDSIKLGLKSLRKRALYYLTITGNEKPKTLLAQSVNGEGVLTIAGQPEGSLSLPNGTHTLEWKPTMLGATLLTIELRDTEQHIRETSVLVTAFDNLPPIAKIKAQKLAQLSPREYLIDASSSTDQDAAYGGSITTYQYTIDSKTFTTDRPSMRWIFENSGSHQISVTVSDAEGATSNHSLNLTIQ